MRIRHLIVSFLSFSGVSGLGWLLDMTILLCLVKFAAVAPFTANFVSSSTAALCVFLISREMIFTKAAGSLLVRIAIYIVYVAVVILLASAAIQIITGQIEKLAGLYELPVSVTAAALAAKIVVTPPQLLLNFFVSRFLSERGIVKPGLTDV